MLRANSYLRRLSPRVAFPALLGFLLMLCLAGSNKSGSVCLHPSNPLEEWSSVR